MILACLCGGRNSERVDVSPSLLLTECREPGFHFQHHGPLSGGVTSEELRGRFAAYAAVRSVLSRNQGAALPGDIAGCPT